MLVAVHVSSRNTRRAGSGRAAPQTTLRAPPSHPGGPARPRGLSFLYVRSRASRKAHRVPTPTLRPCSSCSRTRISARVRSTFSSISVRGNASCGSSLERLALPCGRAATVPVAVSAVYPADRCRLADRETSSRLTARGRCRSGRRPVAPHGECQPWLPRCRAQVDATGSRGHRRSHDRSGAAHCSRAHPVRGLPAAGGGGRGHPRARRSRRFDPPDLPTSWPQPQGGACGSARRAYRRLPGPAKLARRLSTLAQCPVGGWQPQRHRTLAQGTRTGLPKIAARGRGMGDAASTRRAGQDRTAAACAVGTNPGAMADDRSRPLDQGGDADRGCRRERRAGAGRGARGGGRFPDTGSGDGAGQARRVAHACWHRPRRLVRPRSRSGPSCGSGSDHVAMVERPDRRADHQTQAGEAPDVRSRQDRPVASLPDRLHLRMFSESASEPRSNAV